MVHPTLDLVSVPVDEKTKLLKIPMAKYSGAPVEITLIANHRLTPALMQSDSESSLPDLDPESQSENEGASNNRPFSVFRPTAAEMVLVLGALFAPLCRGFSSGFTSPSVTKFVGDGVLKVSNGDVSLYGSLVSWGGMVGCIFSGPAMDRFGRQKILFASAFPQALGWISIAIWSDIREIIMFSRFLIGFGSAIVFAAYGAYIAETVNRKRRGLMCSMCELCISTGTTVAYLLGMFLENRYLALVGAGLAISLALGMLCQLETPRWLVSKGHFVEALKVLKKLRESESAADIKKEMDEIMAKDNEARRFEEKIKAEYISEIESNNKTKSSTLPPPSSSSSSSSFSLASSSSSSSSLASSSSSSSSSLTSSSSSSIPPVSSISPPPTLQKWNVIGMVHLVGKKLKRVKPQLAIGLPMMVLQGFCGQSVVVSFMKSIFKLSKLDDRSAEIAAVAVGCLRIVTTAIASLTVDRLGRRTLLIVGGLGQGLSLILMGFAFYIRHSSGLIRSSLNETDTLGGNKTVFLQNSGSLDFFLTSTNLTGSVNTPLYYSDQQETDVFSLNSRSTGLLFAGICSYLAFYSIGWGTVPSVLVSEMYPQTIRAIASSASTFVALMAGSTAILFFHPLVDAIGESRTFCLFAVDCLVGALYAYLVIPETKSKSLEMIEERINGNSKDIIVPATIIKEITLTLS